jgi:hypothetical protein
MFDRFLHSFFPHNIQGISTVRYAFPLFVASLVAIGLLASVSQNSSYISIKTDVESVNQGDIFYVTVSAYAHVPVNAVDISLSYPDKVIEVENIDTGTSVITLWAEDPSASNGVVNLRGGVFQRGFLGEHTIARLRMRALESGIAQVSLKDVSLIAGDGKGTTVAVHDTGNNEARLYIDAVDGELSGEVIVDIITDVDGDGIVGIKDISVFMTAWFTKGSTYDFNNDGRMTFVDFSILLADSFFK